MAPPASVRFQFAELGAYTITYADGSSREVYRIGLSANTTGISVYVLGLDDKTYLARRYASGPKFSSGSC